MMKIAAALLLAVGVSAYTPLVTFDNARSTSHKWQAVNDPVMVSAISKRGFA